jgi:hypothetical protein
VEVATLLAPPEAGVVLGRLTKDMAAAPETAAVVVAVVLELPVTTHQVMLAVAAALVSNHLLPVLQQSEQAAVEAVGSMLPVALEAKGEAVLVVLALQAQQGQLIQAAVVGAPAMLAALQVVVGDQA